MVIPVIRELPLLVIPGTAAFPVIVDTLVYPDTAVILPQVAIAVTVASQAIALPVVIPVTPAQVDIQDTAVFPAIPAPLVIVATPEYLAIQVIAAYPDTQASQGTVVIHLPPVIVVTALLPAIVDTVEPVHRGIRATLGSPVTLDIQASGHRGTPGTVASVDIPGIAARVVTLVVPVTPQSLVIPAIAQHPGIAVIPAPADTRQQAATAVIPG